MRTSKTIVALILAIAAVLLSTPAHATTLAIETSAVPPGQLGVAYQASLKAAGGTPPYVFTLVEGDLPDGLGLTDDGAITGTPTAVGDAGFTVQVTDAAQATARQAFVATIASTAPPTVMITPATLPEGDVGAHYRAHVTAVGDGGATFGIVGGALPPGVMLAATGAIAGIPTQPGIFTVRIRGTAPDGTRGDIAYRITVHEALRITTIELPPGEVGTRYEQVIGVYGGAGDSRFSLEAGTLPGGLSVETFGLPTPTSGAVSGIPRKAGEYHFTVAATDGLGGSDKRRYTLRVWAPDGPAGRGGSDLPPAGAPPAALWLAAVNLTLLAGLATALRREARPGRVPPKR